jgi:hypothetical protein
MQLFGKSAFSRLDFSKQWHLEASAPNPNHVVFPSPFRCCLHLSPLSWCTGILSEDPASLLAASRRFFEEF